MIRVQQQDFEVEAEIDALTAGNRNIGGVVSFIGLVREFNGGDAITSITLEHYPGMTESELEKIEAEANRRWSLQASLIIHRYGRLDPGDRIVLVVTASEHRQEAFEAAQFLVDWLKTKAPFWKLESGPGGKEWVTARGSDTAAAGQWSKDD